MGGLFVAKEVLVEWSGSGGYKLQGLTIITTKAFSDQVMCGGTPDDLRGGKLVGLLSTNARPQSQANLSVPFGIPTGARLGTDTGGQKTGFCGRGTVLEPSRDF